MNCRRNGIRTTSFVALLSIVAACAHSDYTTSSVASVSQANGEMPAAQIQIGPDVSDNSPSDTSPNAVYLDLRDRGLDPLLGSDQALRLAFIQYDTAMGDASNLNPEFEDAQAAASALNTELAKTTHNSFVRIRTEFPGARIRYRLIGKANLNSMPQLTNSTGRPLRIGLYSIWAERNGERTSTPMVFRVTSERTDIDIEEFETP